MGRQPLVPLSKGIVEGKRKRFGAPIDKDREEDGLTHAERKRQAKADADQEEVYRLFWAESDAAHRLACSESAAGAASSSKGDEAQTAMTSDEAQKEFDAYQARMAAADRIAAAVGCRRG